MGQDAVIVRHSQLQTFITDVLGALGMPPHIAEPTARLMVHTDLRGVDSHGIGMLPRYVEWTQGGFIDPAAEPKTVRDDLATALLDGQKGLGYYPSTVAMELAIAKARTYGVGIVAVRNSNHFGAAANYSMMALAHDMIGLATTNSPYISMVPTFGRAPMLSTNPLSIAAPAGAEPPFVLDMATTTVAVGKLTIASRWGRPIPEGWAMDPTGRPTTDAKVALAHRLLSPLGGSRALGGHKGYGLGVMVDILSGTLSGAVYGNLFFRSDMPKEKLHNVGHCFAAIEPARFRPLEEFKADMDDMLRALKQSPKAEGEERIYTAGEPEAECEQRRLAEGIPLAPVLVRQVNEIARARGVRPLTPNSP
ncbi:MAG: Ldh family oxidoreductase [Candidatus Rokubacteria bacterium]|nr:Ldh family oxidoreductase [Candidatus Rokubacteria bacterium]